MISKPWDYTLFGLEKLVVRELLPEAGRSSPIVTPKTGKMAFRRING